jgi:hypothetical protein
MEFVNRENEIFRMLNLLVEEGRDFVVVGGYAVSGLGKHRFSVDCDVVISKTELYKTEANLRKCGYERDFGKRGFDETYAGEFLGTKRKLVSFRLPLIFLLEV